MARLDVPNGPGGEAAMIWTLRPELGGMVERMIRGAYQESILPPEERELARMRIAQINDCIACSDFRAPSVLDAGIPPDLYENVAAYATYPGYTPRQRMAIEYAERFANEPASIDDGFFERLRGLFTDAEILDLTLCVAVFLGLAGADIFNQRVLVTKLELPAEKSGGRKIDGADPEHPITHGMAPEFTANDELYHRMTHRPGIHVLATAFDDPSSPPDPAPRESIEARTIAFFAPGN